MRKSPSAATRMTNYVLKGKKIRQGQMSYCWPTTLIRWGVLKHMCHGEKEIKVGKTNGFIPKRREKINSPKLVELANCLF